MKYLWTFLVVLALSVPALAEDFVVTEAQYIVISGNTSDTLGRAMITPDSIRIVVTDSAGTELFDAWFESADAQCALNGDIITFFDQWEDINGAASVGVFSIVATIASDADNNIDVYHNQNYTLRGVVTTTEATYADIVTILADVLLLLDTVNAIIDTQQNQDNWIAKEASLLTASDNIGINWGDISNQTTTVGLTNTTVGIVTTVTGGATSAKQDIITDTVNGIIDTLQLQDGWVAKEASLFDWTTNQVIVTTNNDKTGYTLTTAERALIADSVWKADTTGFTAGGTHGYANTHGGAAVISDADMAAIADSVWQVDTTGFTVGGSQGYANTHTGAATITGANMREIADSVWGLDTALADVRTGGMGNYVLDSLQAILDAVQIPANFMADVSAIPDSTTLSNMLHRIVWGTAKGSGSDSSTIAQRDATIAAIVNDIITAAAIADDAIDFATFAGSAPAAWWNEGKTGYSLTVTPPTAAQIYAEMISGSNEDQFKANVSALATASALTNAIDSINAIIDTLQNQDDWIATASALANAIDSINAIIDTLQLQDDWVGTTAKQTLIIDTVNAIIDSSQARSTWLNAKLDSTLWLAGRRTAMAIHKTGTEVDTLFLLQGTTAVADTIGYEVYFHPGGTAGGPPDSVKSYIGTAGI